MYCGKCGSKLENDATFCPYCGNKIDENKDTLSNEEVKENISEDEKNILENTSNAQPIEELNNFEIIFGYWHQGASTLFNNCNINNEDFLLKLPHYSMKKPVNIINSSFTSNGKDGMIVFYDDRTGGSAGELVEQDILTIENNKMSLNNSQYVVSGIDKDTVNNINIAFRNNELLSEKLQLYDKESKECENIKIIEK